jgi:hypothetical protein
MLDVASQDADKLLAADDEQLVKTLPADGADPPLGVGVRVGRVHRCTDDLGAGRAPHVVEHPGELGVPVADQEPPPRSLIAEAGQQIASLLRDPPPSRVRSDAGQVHPSACQLDKEQDVHS